MGDEIKYIKIGSYGGYKVYDDGRYITISQIGFEEIYIPKEIFRLVIDQIKESL